MARLDSFIKESKIPSWADDAASKADGAEMEGKA